MADLVNQHIDEHLETIATLRDGLIDSISEVGVLLARSLTNDNAVFWCGNGGSAADSQHLAAELVGRFKKDRRPLRSIALTTDASILTSVANDYGYDDIFSRQVEALGRPKDVLVAVSTSGNSESIIRAIKVAKAKGMIAVALLGKDGGKAKNLADYTIIIQSNSTARIQEAHILIGHIFCELIESEMGLG